ncbi:hypothetical protein TNCV_4329471 [Trichonephila clavipes]|nr:hypothetical protein TNCV_4329471 [Trichonephila clavipes]
MHTRCLKCDEPHRTNDCPIKEKIANPICINCDKTGHMANWSLCEEFPKIKQKKGEATINRNTVKRTEVNKTFKPVTPDLPFSVALLGGQNENKKPGTSALTEETPQINENNSNENYFVFKDAIIELRKFFLDYPFLLEMGRQFRNANGDERIDISHQHLINSYDLKTQDFILGPPILNDFLNNSRVS